MRLLIKNAQQIQMGLSATVQDIYIADEQIIAIGQAPDGFTPDNTIDAKDHWVLPGLVDTAVRLPYAPQQGSLLSETRAAAAAGILHMLAMPQAAACLDTAAAVDALSKAATAAGFSNIYPLGALTIGLQGAHLPNLLALQQAGSPAVTNGLLPIRNTRTLLQCYQYASNHDIPVFIRAQDPDLCARTLAQEGALATRLGLSARPACSEAIAISQHLYLLAHTGVRAHFSCLHTAQGVEAIRNARHTGLPISASVAMHHLHLTEEAMEGFNPLARLDPPLGSAFDRDALRAAVADGTISAICSDHRTLEETDKLHPFGDATPGLSGLDTFLSLGIHLAHNHILPLEKVLGAMTEGAAACFGLHAGRIAIGATADVIIVNPTASWTVDRARLRSAAKSTPFLGQQLPGLITHVIAAGCLLRF